MVTLDTLKTAQLPCRVTIYGDPKHIMKPRSYPVGSPFMATREYLRAPQTTIQDSHNATIALSRFHRSANHRLAFRHLLAIRGFAMPGSSQLGIKVGDQHRKSFLCFHAVQLFGRMNTIG